MSNSVGVMNKTSQKVGLQCVREGHFNNVHMEGRLKAATNSYLTRCPTQAILVFIWNSFILTDITFGIM